MGPNRESGNWLPEVEICPIRAVPCGNPADADEAMRAGQILAASEIGFLGSVSAEQAKKNAFRIAKLCSVPSGDCPLEKYFGCDRKSALEQLVQIVQ